MSKQIEKDDNLTVSQVYDTLKSPTFLKDLYWDILSLIKEKNTYKLMRETSEKLISQKMEALDGLNDSDADDFRRKTIVTQICSMTYAIDTVYSKILYMKLEKACRSQLPNIISELRNEGKIPDEIWSRFKLNASEAQSSNEDKKVMNNTDVQNPSKVSDVNNGASGTQNADTPNKSPVTLEKGKLKETSYNEDNEKVADKNLKNVVENNSDKKMHLPKKKLGGRIQAISKINTSLPCTSTPKSSLTKENVSKLLDASAKVGEGHALAITKSLLNADDKDSDNESEISVGQVSATSVSSVHTSDLSSYDDEISLSSGDEEKGEKRRLSMRELQEKLSQKSNLSPSITKKSPPKENVSKQAVESEEPKKKENCGETSIESRELGNKALKIDAAGSSAESVCNKPPDGKELPKRSRKPNSRYSSDTILCTSIKIKDRKKSFAAIQSTVEKNSSNECSPQKKKLKTENINGEASNKSQNVDNGVNNTDLDRKNPVKQNDSSEPYKPMFTVRSLTSRRTAPVTLYST